MVLWASAGELPATPLAYCADMPMHLYLRTVIAPAFGIECSDGTAFAKVHTPDLRVVFSNEVADRPLGSLVRDGGELVVSRWPRDAITRRSLEGNARGSPPVVSVV